MWNWFKSIWKSLASPAPVTTSSSAPGAATPGLFKGTGSAEIVSNYTPRAQQVLALARKEADRFNHSFVGTEHLLLGLIVLGQGTAVSVLKKMGLDLEVVRLEVENQVGTGPDQKMVGNIPYTPRVKKVLALAAREARALNHTYVGTEHILLGLLGEGDGAAARVLKNLHVDIEKTRLEILKELDPNFAQQEESAGAGRRASTSTSSKPQVASTFTSSPSPRIPVDTSKRYDIHCTDWSQGVSLHRNVRFIGVRPLFPSLHNDPLLLFVEVELSDGQIIFIARSSIIRFSEHTSSPGSRTLPGEKS